MSFELIEKIITLIIVLGSLVFVHELGHFIVAKLLKVKVLKFSLGFPPKMMGFKKGDTEYMLSWIPLGGYVKMSGENPEEAKGEEGEFLSLVWWKRIPIVAAGPIMNIIFAFIVSITACLVGITIEDSPTDIGSVVSGSFADRFGLKGGDKIIRADDIETPTWLKLSSTLQESFDKKKKTEVPITIARGDSIIVLNLKSSFKDSIYQGIKEEFTTEIKEVNIGYPAYEAGLKPGDKIISINDTMVATWSEMSKIIHNSPSKRMKLVIERKEKDEKKIITVELTTLFDPIEKRGLIGITPFQSRHLYYKRFGLKDAVMLGSANTIGMIGATYSGLWYLITSPAKLSKTVGGPVMIAQMTSKESQKGFGRLLLLVSAISIALAVINLLPIPILDGGHIMFFTIEGIRKKPLSLQKQLLIQQVGMAILILLMVFAFYNDISRIFHRQSALGNHNKVQVVPDTTKQ